MVSIKIKNFYSPKVIIKSETVVTVEKYIAIHISDKDLFSQYIKDIYKLFFFKKAND